ncbi:DUF6985 domain-containing protein [Paractinoplanes lichenicola]|uniref:DUF6985 domain-containing protein n=1 Tax=Paractinoplanes lichenicola TaxID=2802976 RepID=A0ABS1VKK2_9ACTN|nr:hypothetical protein [Actinoplanes lichenicola]MBL7255249.1 hypothetical protein [Actinoplanes lichenicola]
MTEIPGLGPVVEDAAAGWFESSPILVPLLGQEARFLVEGYDAGPDFHAAIRTFLALDRSALVAATPHIYAYYRDITELVDFVDVDIAGPDQVLDHIQPGYEITVSREADHVYVSLECNCDWEPEHGLQLVFRDGAEITKVSPYDGHVTNAAAYGDPALEGIIYRSFR